MKYFEDLELNHPRYTDTYTMEKSEIISFATQWDPQPFHTDEQAAKQWPLGFSASSLHTMAASVKLCQSMKTIKSAIVAGVGWNDVKMPRPVRPGDTIRVKTWMSKKRESKSKPGCGVLTSEFEVYNQNDELVLSYNITTLVRKRPDQG